MGLCHLKNSNLEQKFQKYKGRRRTPRWCCGGRFRLLRSFTERGSSASHMTTAKVLDVIARLLGCAGQAADAVSAYTQVKMVDAHKLLKFPNSECPDIGYVYHDTNGLNHGPVWKTQSFFLNEICMVILWQDCCGKRRLENVLLEDGWENVPNWECLFVNREKGLF